MHAHGYKATVLGAVAARLSGARFVRTEHGRLEPTTGLDRLKMASNIKLETLVSRYGADAVVFVSRDVQEQSRSVRAATRQQVIYNGIEPSLTRAAAAALVGFDEGSDSFNVGY